MNVAVGSSRRFDWAMVAPVACLVALGVVMVYSSSAITAVGAENFKPSCRWIPAPRPESNVMLFD